MATNSNDKFIKVLKMSEADVAQITADNIVEIYSQMSKELERRKFLYDRYTREEELNEYFDASDEERKTLKSVVPLEHSSVDTAVGYILGKPVTYYSRKTADTEEYIDIFGNKRVRVKKQNADEMLTVLLNVLKNNNEAEHNINLIRDTLVCRTAYELIYRNEDGDIEFAKGNPLTDFAIYNLDIKPKLIGYIRKYEQTSYITNTTKTIYELRTKEKAVKFIDDNGKMTTEGLFRNAVGEMQELLPASTPFGVVEYPMPGRIGFFEQQLPEVMEYEKSKTDIKQLLRYNQETAKLIVAGMEMPDDIPDSEKEDYIVDILTSNVLFAGDNPDGVNAFKWLTKQIDDAVFEHKKGGEKNDIYSTLGMVNPSESDAVYQNYLALRYKMYGLDQKASELWTTYEKGLLTRAKIIIALYNEQNKTDYDASVVDCTFTANIPVDKATEMAMFGQLNGLVSRETVYSMSSFIENPHTEVERLNQQRIDDAKIEAQILQITAEATESDIATPNNVTGQETSKTAQNNEVDANGEAQQNKSI